MIITEYIGIIMKLGFTNVITHKIKQITIPIDVLQKYLSRREIDEFWFGERGIFSITISGYK